MPAQILCPFKIELCDYFVVVFFYKLKEGEYMSNIGNKKTMSENLSYYIELFGKTQKELAETFGIAYSTFNDWVNGKKYPRIDKIEMMAQYFGILKSDLIEDKSMKEKPDEMAVLAASILRDPELLEMIKKYRKLTDKNKIAVLQMIENLSE